MIATAPAGRSRVAPLPEPQPVLTPLSSAAIVLVGVVPDDPAAATTVREFGADLPGLVRAVGFRDPSAGLCCVIGFGAAAWPRLFGAPAPPGLHPFEPLHGVHDAPATPGDVFLHIRADRADLCFELAARILDRLSGAFRPEFEVQGFRYFDLRDLLGFVDGTENPTGSALAPAALIPAGEHAGGSYVIVQKYLHDLAAWNALDTRDQERIIGRGKLDNIEIAEAELPTSAHRLLTSITDADGAELQIVRDNMPFGSPAAGEFGTLFLGYAADPGVTETMLQNMFLGDPPGNYDHILDFSTAVTGGLFFVPSATALEELAGAAPAADAGGDRGATDGLGIGSLRPPT
jgi:putative iron-dependent peroxidase